MASSFSVLDGALPLLFSFAESMDLPSPEVVETLTVVEPEFFQGNSITIKS